MRIIYWNLLLLMGLTHSALSQNISLSRYVNFDGDASRFATIASGDFLHYLSEESKSNDLYLTFHYQVDPDSIPDWRLYLLQFSKRDFRSDSTFELISAPDVELRERDSVYYQHAYVKLLGDSLIHVVYSIESVWAKGAIRRVTFSRSSLPEGFSISADSLKILYEKERTAKPLRASGLPPPPPVNSASTKKYKQYFSRYKPIFIKYSEPLEKVSGYDNDQATLVGFIDKRDGTSLTIKMEPYTRISTLTDEAYHAMIKEKMLSENARNTFISEKDTLFHGKIFHLQQFVMHTEKWGKLKLSCFTNRDGIYLTLIQVAHPLKEDENMKGSFPPEILELNDRIRIDEK